MASATARMDSANRAVSATNPREQDRGVGTGVGGIPAERLFATDEDRTADE